MFSLLGYDSSINEDYYCCRLFYYAKSFASVDKCLYHSVQYNPSNLTKNLYKTLGVRRQL